MSPQQSRTARSPLIAANSSGKPKTALNDTDPAANVAPYSVPDPSGLGALRTDDWGAKMARVMPISSAIVTRWEICANVVLVCAVFL